MKRGDNKKKPNRHTSVTGQHQLGWKAPAGKSQRLRALNSVNTGHVGAKESSKRRESALSLADHKNLVGGNHQGEQAGGLQGEEVSLRVTTHSEPGGQSKAGPRNPGAAKGRQSLESDMGEVMRGAATEWKRIGKISVVREADNFHKSIPEWAEEKGSSGKGEISVYFHGQL